MGFIPEISCVTHFLPLKWHLCFEGLMCFDFIKSDELSVIKKCSTGVSSIAESTIVHLLNVIIERFISARADEASESWRATTVK